jgi:hypothetical protein
MKMNLAQDLDIPRALYGLLETRREKARETDK